MSEQKEKLDEIIEELKAQSLAINFLKREIEIIYEKISIIESNIDVIYGNEEIRMMGERSETFYAD